MGDQVPDGVDAVVRRGVELVDVERRAAAISTQDEQTPHGSPSWGSAQFSALARMRAVDVFPVPRGPLNR